MNGFLAGILTAGAFALVAMLVGAVVAETHGNLIKEECDLYSKTKIGRGMYEGKKLGEVK